MTLLVAGSGCQKYRARPLVPSDVVAHVDRSRLVVVQNGEAPAFTFARAVELARDHSPALKQAHAEHRTALALAKVRTPLPNPAVEAGPQFGFGPDVAATHRLQPFGSLGFTIPTGRRLKRQDELNQMNAALAGVEVQAKHREIYLELRELYTRLALGQLRISRRREISESAEKSTQLVRKQIDAGMATALDLGLTELEQARWRTQLLDAEDEINQLRGKLSRLIGVQAEAFNTLPNDALPLVPESMPSRDELRDLLVTNHPELARLRAQYDVAERQLHLEIAKQYPDFHIGPTFQRETGQRKNILGLTLGIELPIFDRNQQAVATATEKREEVRGKFEAEANRILATLDEAYGSAQIAAQKLVLLKTVLLPKAEENIRFARKSVEAGATDALKLLETERGQRTLQIEAVETEIAVRSAWVALERAVGLPLFTFPTERAEMTPAPLDAVPDSRDPEVLDADVAKKEQAK